MKLSTSFGEHLDNLIFHVAAHVIPHFLSCLISLFLTDLKDFFLSSSESYFLPVPSTSHAPLPLALLSSDTAPFFWAHHKATPPFQVILLSFFHSLDSLMPWKAVVVMGVIIKLQAREFEACSISHPLPRSG